MKIIKPLSTILSGIAWTFALLYVFIISLFGWSGTLAGSPAFVSTAFFLRNGGKIIATEIALTFALLSFALVLRYFHHSQFKQTAARIVLWLIVANSLYMLANACNYPYISRSISWQHTEWIGPKINILFKLSIAQCLCGLYLAYYLSKRDAVTSKQKTGLYAFFIIAILLALAVMLFAEKPTPFIGG